jgi:hypothetical protein
MITKIRIALTSLTLLFCSPVLLALPPGTEEPDGTQSYAMCAAVAQVHIHFLERDIPLFGRIISVVDVYDALTSDRAYRKAMLPSRAFEYILSGYNTMFDPLIVESFIKKVAFFPVGTCVLLSNGAVGIVVENFESSYLRPLVRIIKDKKLTEDYLDLAHDSSTLNITIQEIVNL